MLYVEESEIVYVTEKIFNRETGLIAYQRTLLNGVLESAPDDAPSVVHYDKLGRPDRMEWHRLGQWHRDSGPSVIYINPENGVHVLESFHHNGVARARPFGPNRILRDHDTGEIESCTHESNFAFCGRSTRLKPPSP